MNWGELTTIAVTILLSLGGGGVIVLGLANWIGRILADRYVEKLRSEIQQEIESHRARLRKSEFLFQREFEAASEFISLRRSLMPSYRFRDMEWTDACEEFASNFTKVEKELERYIALHGAALKTDILDRISNATEDAASGKFEVSRGEVTSRGIDLADKVMKELEEVENKIRDAVWSQSGT